MELGFWDNFSLKKEPASLKETEENHDGSVPMQARQHKESKFSELSVPLNNAPSSS